MTDKNGLHLLPKGWVWSSLGEAFEVSVGATPSRAKSEYWDGHIPWVSSGEVGFCRIIKTREKITETGLKNSSTKLHPPGTVLLGMIGEGKTRGQAAILDIEACNNQNSAAIRVSEMGLSPDYIYYFLEGEYERTRKLGSGNNQPALNKTRVQMMRFPLPPLAEQYRIVAKIEELFTKLDAGVAALKAVKAQLKRYRQSVLKAAVEGRLTKEWREAHKDQLEPASVLLERILKERRERWETDQLAKMKAEGKTPKNDEWKKKYKEPKNCDETELPAIPNEWAWVSIEELAEPHPNALKAGPFGSALKKEFYVPSGYKIYGQEQVIRGNPYYGDYYIDSELYESLKSCAVKPKDVLISLVGTIGKVLVLPDKIEQGIINPRLVKLSLNQSLINPNLIKFFFESPNVKQYLSLASHGGTMDILNLTILKELPIPLPPLSEQERIISEVERILSIITEIERNIDYNLAFADRLRQSILKRAFEGKLVPQDPNDEPAATLLERIKQERAAQETASKQHKRGKQKSKSESESKSETDPTEPLQMEMF